MSVSWVTKREVPEALARRVLATDVVLDVGPGIQPQQLVTPGLQIFVEAHRPYVERLRAIVANEARAVFLNGTWDAALGLLPDRCVDTVFALDFIEHLEKEDGRRFLAEASRVAREQVVIFTPLGFYPQSHADDGSDRWGMDGGYWQTHRSGWVPEDFDESWDVLCCREFHMVDEHEQPLAEPFGALWAVRNAGHVAETGRRNSIGRWPTVAAARSATPRARLVRAVRTVLPGPAYRVLRNSALRVLSAVR